jgi:putative ABC transport system permease protein
MNMLSLAGRYLVARPLAAGLNLLLLTLGLGSITFLLLVSTQIDQAFDRDLAGIDVVVGAKGSPMQLILAGVFHIDVPPGNIPLAAVRALEKDARVATLIPISLGDTFRGFRVVGTTPAYASHYGATLRQGASWNAPMQAVPGAAVAASTGLVVGSRFVGSHGLGSGGHDHGDEPYLVTGVLAPCGCVLDRLILTATESVWKVHDESASPDEAQQKAIEAGREVTLALITYRSPLAAVSFPRFVNTTTGMQAAAPAVEVTRLLRMVGVGTDVLRGFAAVLLLTAGLGVFIALWNAVRERRADLAMLRMLGAPPAKVAGLVLCEAVLLAVVAIVSGLAAGHCLADLAGFWLQSERSLPLTGWIWLPAEWGVVGLGLAVACIAALLPAWGAYRLDVTTLLNSRS